ncbi:hypothetical protein QBC38DRAFT_102609 [Podospora fimiseda]|uniref:Transmembrane protein n=1 Tax=Podospora fimiseda TaxID=252190 RepID=A0AAN6YQ62_9PEZI|nr:hypothetical protein QBC38DRAFT_102609 [Podospora fimiseda]
MKWDEKDEMDGQDGIYYRGRKGIGGMVFEINLVVDCVLSKFLFVVSLVLFPFSCCVCVVGVWQPEPVRRGNGGRGERILFLIQDCQKIESTLKIVKGRCFFIFNLSYFSVFPFYLFSSFFL